MAEEQIPVVNDKDEIIDVRSFSEVHKLGLLHRESYVYLINSRKVLLQKRSDNHLWDHSAAGHFSKEESYLEGAKREFEEELGVKIELSELQKIAREYLSSIKPSKKNIRFAEIFLVKKEIPINEFKIDPKELLEVKYFTKSELLELLKDSTIFTNTSQKILKEYILKLL